MTVLSFLRRGRHEDEQAVLIADSAPAPKEVFVLPGGGSLGAAQVGTMQALLAAGIVPDLIVGCSAGAFNGTFVAIDPTYERTLELEAVWRGWTRKSFFHGSKAGMLRHLMQGDDHVYSTRGLNVILNETIPIVDLSETAVPVHAVTIDLESGQPCYWSSGNAHEILRATTALPGLFPPVMLDGRPQVDGGVVVPVPTQRALDLGAQRVWVLEHNREWHGFTGKSMNAFDVLLDSFAIARAHLGRIPPVAAPGQRVVYVPPLNIGRHDMRDFSRTSELIAAGRESGRAMVEAERRAAISSSQIKAGSAAS